MCVCLIEYTHTYTDWPTPLHALHSQTTKQTKQTQNRVLSDNNAKSSSNGTGNVSLAAAKQWGREEAERGLTLAGLLVVDCPLKKDTAGVIRELQVCVCGSVVMMFLPF